MSDISEDIPYDEGEDNFDLEYKLSDDGDTSLNERMTASHKTNTMQGSFQKQEVATVAVPMDTSFNKESSFKQRESTPAKSVSFKRETRQEVR